MSEFLPQVIRDVIILFIVLTPVVVFLFYLSKIKRPPWSVVANLYLIAVVGVAVLSIGVSIYTTYSQPPKWDFLCFWLDAKVAISGENFYDPENYGKIALPYDPGEGFREEIIDVGFKYPPFTMFFFVPLGLFNISHAYLLWQIANLILCGACIYKLWRLFLKDYGVLSLLFLAALLLLLSPTRATLHYAQTNLLTLLFFLMFWENRSKGTAGIWLALCVVVKPYMAVLLLYPLLTRKWKLFTTAVLTLLILTFLSFLVFGSDVVASFLKDPIPETPIWNYTELTNQSLLATILRSTRNQTASESLILNPLFLGISLILTFITAWTTIRKNNNQDWAILSILFLALLVYPGNQSFYSVFLIIPVVLLLQKTTQNIKERIAIFFIILITYFLSDFGNYMFYANLFMWLVCIIMAAKPSFEKADGSDSVMAPTLSTDSVGPG